jgi:hypothetical protein
VPIGSEVATRVDLALLEREAELTGREDLPFDVLARVESVGPHHAVGEDEGRRAHARDSDALALEVLDRLDVRLDARLHAQATGVDAAGHSHVQALLDGLEEVHDQVVGDVEPAQREHVLVFGPLALHELGLEPLLLEEAVLHGRVDRCLAGDADVAHLDLGQALLRLLRGCTLFEHPSWSRTASEAVASSAAREVFMSGIGGVRLVRGEPRQLPAEIGNPS